VPANTYTAFQGVGTTVLALNTAYATVFAGLDAMTYTPAGGHVDQSIPLNELATLVDELDAVIAAVAPLV
jgi:hypothetical protein